MVEVPLVRTDRRPTRHAQRGLVSHYTPHTGFVAIAIVAIGAVCLYGQSEDTLDFEKLNELIYQHRIQRYEDTEPDYNTLKQALPRDDMEVRRVYVDLKHRYVYFREKAEDQEDQILILEATIRELRSRNVVVNILLPIANVIFAALISQLVILYQNRIWERLVLRQTPSPEASRQNKLVE